MGLVNYNPFGAQGVDDYLVDGQFDTADTAAPDGLAPDHGDDLKIARTGVGTFTLTFAGPKKPKRVRGMAAILGDEPDLFAKVTSYVESTGIVTLKVYENSAGTIAAADTDNKKVQYFLFCTKAARSK